MNQQQQFQDSYNKPLSAVTAIPYVGYRLITVTYSGEMTGTCPITGSKDIYLFAITIEPDLLLPELSSLKRYLDDFSELPISYEHIAPKIWQYLKEVLKPQNLKVVLKNETHRSGIDATKSSLPARMTSSPSWKRFTPKVARTGNKKEKPSQVERRP